MSTCVQPEITDDVVFDYWQKKANEKGLDRSATIRDHHYHKLEIATISRFLRNSDHVLDIGCGNGIATLSFAERVESIIGADFSPEMIAGAKQRISDKPSGCKKLSFEVADARDLPFDDGQFSRVIMQRCLINIPDRNEQVQAALEAGRTLRSGELFLLAEVTLQGHERTNKHRVVHGLDKLKVHWHNTYIDEPSFIAGVEDQLELVETIRFGMYGFLSKVVHPLMVAPEEPSFDAKINEVAAKIAEKTPDYDGCSHQVLFVFRKK